MDGDEKIKKDENYKEGKTFDILDVDEEDVKKVKKSSTAKKTTSKYVRKTPKKLTAEEKNERIIETFQNIKSQYVPPLVSLSAMAAHIPENEIRVMTPDGEKLTDWGILLTPPDPLIYQISQTLVEFEGTEAGKKTKEKVEKYLPYVSLLALAYGISRYAGSVVAVKNLYEFQHKPQEQKIDIVKGDEEKVKNANPIDNTPVIPVDLNNL